MSEFSATDCTHMADAIRLGWRGRYGAHPNPRVGCVIVNGDEVVGRGFHARAGEGHAEVNALAEAGDRARGADAFVSLEPCNHQGRTGPCVDALLDAGVGRVVAAMQDPFPEVAGQGLARLAENGVATAVGLLEAEARALNEGYLSRLEQARPFVRLKLAASTDGATAMASGESQWITGEAARRDVQRLRAMSGAILTGIGTVLDDDPSLTVREVDVPAQPLRVVLDSQLRTPPEAKLFSTAGDVLLCSTTDAGREPLEVAGAEVLISPADGQQIDVAGVLRELAKREVNDVLVECGPTLAGHLLSTGLVDELVIYQAPHIMGSETRPMFATATWQKLDDRLGLNVIDVRRVGADTRITARPA